MLDTRENIQDTKKQWEEIDKELGITEEIINDPKYDYMDDKEE